MKNNVSKFLAAALVFSSALAERGTNTNLTNLKVRDWYNNPYSMTGGSRAMMMENMEREDCIGACFSLMGFYEGAEHSRVSKELGKGLGVNKLNSFEIKPSAAFAEGATPHSNSTSTVDVEFLRQVNPNAGVLVTPLATHYPTVKLDLEAKHRRYGADLAYCQDLGNFYEGLKFRVSASLQGVRNEVVNNFTEVAAATSANAQNVTTANIKDFFTAGSTANVSAGTGTAGAAGGLLGQKALERAVFNTTHQTEHHINDVRGCLGLNIVDSENAKVCVGIEGVIPVGRELDGKYLFEPHVGNRHFKLGANVDVHACLSEGSDYKASLTACGLWHYAFKREDVRFASHTKVNYGHYHLGYKKGSTSGQLQPIINLLPYKVDVKPANLFNGTAMLTLEKGCFCFDLGYNFYYSQDEKNDVKGFNESEIYVVSPSFGSNNAFDGSTVTNKLGTAANAAVKAVTKTDLTWDVKSQSHHHIFASVGFMCKDWEYPASLNVFGGYEFAHNRTRAREAWSVGVKGGLCF